MLLTFSKFNNGFNNEELRSALLVKLSCSFLRTFDASIDSDTEDTFDKSSISLFALYFSFNDFWYPCLLYGDCIYGPSFYYNSFLKLSESF